MKTNKSRVIDWNVAGLNGGIFTVGAPRMSMDSLSPTDAAPPQAAAPARPTWGKIAGIFGVVVFGSVCAMTLARPAPRPTVALAAPGAMAALVEAAGPAPVIAVAPVAAAEPAPVAVAAPVIAAAAVPVSATPARRAWVTAAAIPAPAAAPAPIDDAKGLVGGGVETSPALPAEINRSAATTALSVAARRAAACLDESAASTSMPVSVTFMPSGRVTTATVDGGAYAGTEAGGCIARALRSATVGAFDGAPVTVHHTIRVR